LEIGAAGVTNSTTGVEITPDTVLHIGSITKVLTATLVMQLVDEGRVQLDAPLKRYIPEFQLADRSAAERITVEMLLNHTSGIPEWGAGFMQSLVKEPEHTRQPLEAVMLPGGCAASAARAQRDRERLAVGVGQASQRDEDLACIGRS